MQVSVPSGERLRFHCVNLLRLLRSKNSLATPSVVVVVPVLPPPPPASPASAAASPACAHKAAYKCKGKFKARTVQTLTENEQSGIERFHSHPHVLDQNFL